ncbi:MAG TPA: glutamate formimidoyltransferase [Edaphocola sp.]|nr:glutamate formimidoyltransferase [Edaphocola sp.]
MDKIIECVANISIGRQGEALEMIKAAIRQVEGQQLLDVDSSLSANRSVLTFAGDPRSVVEAAFQMYKTAAELIDMRYHHGSHPRIGAIDVCPLVPLQNISKKEVVQLTYDLAAKVGYLLHIPVYLYEFSAKKSYRCQLPQIRKGGYENLPNKMAKANWQPDFGPGIDSAFRENIFRSGASVMGCRKILVAFNISIDTQSVAIARKIAYRIRTSGWPEKTARKPTETCLEYPALRAIGWYSEDYGCAQVSCNFINYKKTSPLTVWEKVKSLAQEYGCEAIGCEVIGLIPEVCILDAGLFAARQSLKLSLLQKKDLILSGMEHFNFKALRPFDPNHKILEYRLQEL